MTANEMDDRFSVDRRIIKVLGKTAERFESYAIGATDAGDLMLHSAEFEVSPEVAACSERPSDTPQAQAKAAGGQAVALAWKEQLPGDLLLPPTSFPMPKQQK